MIKISKTIFSQQIKIKCPTLPYKPLRLKNLEVGKTMAFCTCALTKNHPWCDGSHKGTEYKPLRFKVPERRPGRDFHSICQCRISKNMPFCDGAHKTLWADGKPPPATKNAKK